MAPEITVRGFTDGDYGFLAEAYGVVYDEPARSVDLYRHADANRDPSLFFARHIVEVDGRRAGCGEVGHSSWFDDPDKYWFQILVPSEADAAIRPVYLAHAEGLLAPQAPRALVSGMLETRADHIEFLARNEFREVHREHFSRLELTTFEPERFASELAAVTGQGIGIVCLADLVEEMPDWRQRLHPVYEQLVADQPAPDPPRLDSREDWDRRVLGAPDFDPTLWMLALDGERIVGLSQAAVNSEDPSAMDCGLTGVLASHRRRGIATALKVRLLAAAKQTGAAIIATGNEANNPMYAINLGLGFVPGSDWVMYEKAM